MANREESCANCKQLKDLIKYDYSNGGCVHIPYTGFACTAFGSEGVITHMIGLNPNTGYCEMFIPRGEKNDNTV